MAFNIDRTIKMVEDTFCDMHPGLRAAAQDRCVPVMLYISMAVKSALENESQILAEMDDIGCLEISVRAQNLLYKNNLSTISALKRAGLSEIRSIKFLGKAIYNEIIRACEKYRVKICDEGE